MGGPVVPELYVRRLETSLAFYVQGLGFSVKYDRPEDRFTYLARGAAELMLEEPIGRTWLTAPLEYPFGRGINLQIACADTQALYERLSGTTAIIQPLERKSYRRAHDAVVVDQFVVADPDGHLLRFSTTIEAEAITPARPQAKP